MAFNTTEMDAFYNLPNEEQLPHLTLSEGAIGGMIPTSICILLLALIRIVRVYQQHRRKYKAKECTE